MRDTRGLAAWERLSWTATVLIALAILAAIALVQSTRLPDSATYVRRTHRVCMGMVCRRFYSWERP